MPCSAPFRNTVASPSPASFSSTYEKAATLSTPKLPRKYAAPWRSKAPQLPATPCRQCLGLKERSAQCLEAELTKKESVELKAIAGACVKAKE